MNLDAVVLAVAGLSRLGLDDAIGEALPLDLFPPSPGQGALGIQVREGNTAVREILSSVGDRAVDAEVRAERALLAELHGGCSVPVGAYAVTQSDGTLMLNAQVTSLDGRKRAAGTLSGPAGEPEKLGATLARELLGQGAGEILAEIRPTR
jgi:hydroxymethylbilane synthase